MARAALFAVLVLLAATLPLGTVPEAKPSHDITYAPSQDLVYIERDWTLNVILVDYDADNINEDTLLNTMPASRLHQTDDVGITYNFDYQIHYANESYSSALRAFALDNSVNGTGIGTKLNSSALSIQRGDPGTPIRVFNPRDGRAIDGIALEDWLMEHPCVAPPSLGYNLYLLNFSSMDTPGHELEHWYDYAAQDPDTGMMQDWFRLEFDHDLNPPLEMQYAGFGGRGNIYALDPSANQWYLRWARIWWQDYIGADYDHWTKDLEDKVAEVDLGTPTGVNQLSVYLRNYMFDIVSFLLFPVQHSPAKYVTSGELRVTVVCMDVESGISVDSLRWVTDAEMQQHHLEELYPFIDWNVQLDFVDINQDAAWNYTFWRSASVNEEGVTEVDGGEMFNYIYEVVRPYRIPTGPDLVSVFGVVFIKQNMVMYYGDGTYTGLGYNGEFGGQTVIWKSWERYYRSDNVTPRNGVSSVQLHESMHAVGFGHTWVHEHYTGDFSYGPMGYFADHNGTSSFDKDWVQGTFLDQMEALTWDEFQYRQTFVEPTDREETLLAEQNALTCFDLAREAYNQMDWLKCYDMLCKARDWSKRMIYSRHDSVAPMIQRWGTIPARPSTDSFTYWATVTDDTAGLENVTVYVQVDNSTPLVYPCEYGGGNWSCVIDPVVYDEAATVWLVAWDWAMNSAEGGLLRLPLGEGLNPLVVGAAVTVSVLSLAGVVIVLRRRVHPS